MSKYSYILISFILTLIIVNELNSTDDKEKIKYLYNKCSLKEIDLRKCKSNNDRIKINVFPDRTNVRVYDGIKLYVFIENISTNCVALPKDFLFSTNGIIKIVIKNIDNEKIKVVYSKMNSCYPYIKKEVESEKDLIFLMPYYMIGGEKKIDNSIIEDDDFFGEYKIVKLEITVLFDPVLSDKNLDRRLVEKYNIITDCVVSEPIIINITR